MQRDRQRIAEPQSQGNQQSDVEDKKGQRDIRPRCAGDDERA